MKRNQAQITERICNQMKIRDCDAMILTTPYSIYYSTGFAGSFLYKMHQTGLSIAVVLKTGKTYLIVSEFESMEAKEYCSDDVEILVYPTFIFIDDYAENAAPKKEQNDPLETFHMAINILDKEPWISNVGIEMSSIPYHVQDYFNNLGKGYEYQEADVIVREAKAIKTPWEISILSRTARIDEIAMDKVGAELQEGMSHAEVLNRYKRYCFEQDPEVIEVNQFHTFGPKFSPTYIFSTNKIKCGDIVRLDGGPTIAGYYSDIARNYAVGNSMTDRQKEIYQALWKGYQIGIEMIRPGVRMCDVFNKMVQTIIESGIPNYSRGHHGHAIGCGSSAEDYPFISASQERVFEPGMVMCLEAPYYSSKNSSFNIEDTFVVTEDGIELFSHSNPLV